MKSTPLLSATAAAAICCLSASAQNTPSPPRIESIQRQPNGFWRISWQAAPGRTDFVQWSENLEEWFWLPVVISGPGAAQYQADIRDRQTNLPPPRVFFRLVSTDTPVKISAKLDDFDGDGISNWDELATTHTNPLAWDTDGDGKSDYFTDSDGDGMADGWELKHFGGLDSADPSADPDSDGLDNAAESQLKSNPNSEDTDADGLPDAEDAAPANALVDWRKTPVPLFILDMLPIPDISGHILEDFSENGTVLFRKSNPAGADTRIVVDRAGILRPALPLEPSQIGEFGCDCPTLFDDMIFGVRRETAEGFPNGSNKDRLWNPLAAAGSRYTAFPPYGDLFPGYHDDILDVRGDFRAEHRTGVPWALSISTPFGQLPGTDSDRKASIERQGNIVLPRKYYRFAPADNGGGSYQPALVLPRLSTVRSSTLVQSNENGPENRWHLVCSQYDIFHPFTPPDLMLSKNSAAFQPAGLDGAACRTLVGSGAGWVAARRSLWCNGQWRKLQDIASTPPGVEKILLLDILDNGTGVARVTLNDGTEKFGLLRMPRVAELHPKLRDEADLEIEGSQYPLALPASNEMVERDPGANLPDASAVRIAWREIKVEIGKNFAGKTVEWSMEPLFTPWHNATEENPAGEPEDAPRFRGKWGTAAGAAHRNYFSASAQYGAHGFIARSPAVEEATNARVHRRATTIVDENGLTAIRVNLPPIGFNKARVRIEIDGRPPLDLLDLEVPAVVVIDPGHGGCDPGADSISGIMTESQVALDVALRAEPHICQILDSISGNYKLLFTRKDDSYVSIAGQNRFSRQGMQRYNGADLFLSIHCNSGPPAARRIETNIQWGEMAWENLTPMQADQGNYNHDEDHHFAQEVNDRIAEALQSYDPTTPNDGVKRNNRFNHGPGVLRDSPTSNGNTRSTTPSWHPLRSALVELEFISNRQGDNLLISSHPNPEPDLQSTWQSWEVRESIAVHIADAVGTIIKQ